MASGKRRSTSQHHATPSNSRGFHLVCVTPQVSRRVALPEVRRVSSDVARMVMCFTGMTGRAYNMVASGTLKTRTHKVHAENSNLTI